MFYFFYFGVNMKVLVLLKLFKDVEGSCIGIYFIVFIMDILDIFEGCILFSSGLVEFIVRYCVVVL